MEQHLLILAVDVEGEPVAPGPDPTRAPALIIPLDEPEPNPDEPAPTPVIPDAYEISFDGDIVLLFSEPLDPTTVNESSIQVLDPEGEPVSAEFTTEFGDSAIRITPKRNLRLGALYQVVLSSGIRDSNDQNFPGATLAFECPGPSQVATIDLPNPLDVGLIDGVVVDDFLIDGVVTDGVLLEDVLVAVAFPIGSDEPGAIHAYQVRDETNPDLLLEEPRLLGSTKTFGTPRSLAVDGDRVFVGNQWEGPIVLQEATLSYTPELYGVFNVGGIPILHEGLQPNLSYHWSSGLPTPPSNLEVFDLSDPRTPTRLGGNLSNFRSIFDNPHSWDPNTFPTRVEVTDQGVAVLSFLDNIEFFDPAEPFESAGVLEQIWGPGVEPGRCQGGREDGQVCPLYYVPPFWSCLDSARCVRTSEFFDAAFFDGFAVMLQRDGVRIVSTENLDDPLVFDSTLSDIPLPGGGHGHVGAVPGFEWEDSEGMLQEMDLAFVATSGDRRLRIFDVTEPTSPTELGSLPDTRGNMSFDACTGLAYMKSVHGEFHVIDFNDPTDPQELNNPGQGREPFRIEALGPTASFNGNTNDDHVVYLAEEAGIAIVNARFCTAPELLEGTQSPLVLASIDPMATSVALAMSTGNNTSSAASRRRSRKKPCVLIPVKGKGKLRRACDPVDLDIVGIDEKDEHEQEKPSATGGLVLLNDDDDDLPFGPRSGFFRIKDSDQNTLDGTIENDLIKIALRINLSKGEKENLLTNDPDAEVELKITKGGQRVRLVDAAGQKFTSRKWKPTEVPDHLLVSGRKLSSALRDVELTLSLRAQIQGLPRIFKDAVQLTVVKIELEPITSEPTDSATGFSKFPLYNPGVVLKGGTARFSVNIKPNIPKKSIVWKEVPAPAHILQESAVLGALEGSLGQDDPSSEMTIPACSSGDFLPQGKKLEIDTNTGSLVTVKGMETGSATLRVDIMNLTQQVCANEQFEGIKGHVPTIQTFVAADRALVFLDVYIQCDNGGGQCARPPNLASVLTNVNKIYEQVGIEWRLARFVEEIPNAEFLDRDPSLSIADQCGDVADQREGTIGAELYFIRSMELAGCDTRKGLVVAVNKRNGEPKNDLELAWVTAHELGHALEWLDIYPIEIIAPNRALDTVNQIITEKSMDTANWNNGPGRQYYRSGLKQVDLIARLLMCGQEGHSNLCGDSTNPGIRGMDIPIGTVFGWRKEDRVLGPSETYFQSQTCVGPARLTSRQRMVSLFGDGPTAVPIVDEEGAVILIRPPPLHDENFAQRLVDLFSKCGIP